MSNARDLQRRWVVAELRKAFVGAQHFGLRYGWDDGPGNVDTGDLLAELEVHGVPPELGRIVGAKLRADHSPPA